MKNRYSAIILLFSIVHSSSAQDLEFSQFLSAPLYLNPAFAGVDEGPRFCLNYRNQWSSLGNAFMSYGASYDEHFEKIGGGVGVMVVSDREADGLYVGNTVSGIYAYQINLSRQFGLKGAAQVSMVQKRVDASRLVFEENINPDDGTISSVASTDLPDVTSRTFADFTFGALLFTKKFFAGVTVKHITSPNETMISDQNSSLPLRWGTNLGFEFHSRKGKQTPVFFTPNIMFAQQSKFKQINGGATLGISVIYAGLYYRTTFSNADAMILLVGLKKGVFKLGYSYDATISELGGAGGAHELSLILNFHDSEKINSKKHSRRFKDCPDIF